MKRDFNYLIALVNNLSNDDDIKTKEEIAIKAIPELTAFKDVLCHHPAHKYDDILEHTLVSLKAVDSYIKKKDNFSAFDIAIIKIVLLLHDIGKTTTQTTNKNGITHFYNHPIESARMATNILNQYDIDEVTKTTIINLIKLHDDYINYDSDDGLIETINNIGLKETGMLLKIQRADLNAHSDYYVISKTPMFDALDKMYDRIINKGNNND
jgi:tRNA nucleotidyltransferase (CCA-adding enzyme)